jgi:hypothetical protein
MAINGLCVLTSGQLGIRSNGIIELYKALPFPKYIPASPSRTAEPKPTMREVLLSLNNNLVFRAPSPFSSAGCESFFL